MIQQIKRHDELLVENQHLVKHIAQIKTKQKELPKIYKGKSYAYFTKLDEKKIHKENKRFREILSNKTAVISKRRLDNDYKQNMSHIKRNAFKNNSYEFLYL